LKITELESTRGALCPTWCDGRHQHRVYDVARWKWVEFGPAKRRHHPRCYFESQNGSKPEHRTDYRTEHIVTQKPGRGGERGSHSATMPHQIPSVSPSWVRAHPLCEALFVQVPNHLGHRANQFWGRERPLNDAAHEHHKDFEPPKRHVPCCHGSACVVSDDSGAREITPPVTARRVGITAMKISGAGGFKVRVFLKRICVVLSIYFSALVVFMSVFET
jgi:hypothetical protein